MGKKGRRLAGIVFALLMGTLFVPTEVAANDAPDNLVRNPGFEHNLNHWHTSVGTAVYSIDETTKVSGCCSVMGVETDPGSLGRLYQDVTDDTQPGNLYRISGWIKTSNVIGNFVIGMDYVGTNPLGVTPFDGHVMEIGNVGGTHDWTFYKSPVFFLPAMPSDAVALWFFLDFNSGAGTAWSDDVSLTRVETEEPNALTVVASPPTIPANGTSSSAVTVTVTNAGQPIAGEPVTFAASGAPLPACGTLTQASATTNAIGQATSFYISSLTVGSCMITVTDSSGGKGSVTITQTAPPNTLIVMANPPFIPANGASTSTITVTVTSLGLAVGGDLVTFGENQNPPSPACGTLNPAAAVTNALGQATSTYISSLTAGFCIVTATDSSGGTGSVTLTQTAPPNTLNLVANPPILPANGTSSSAIMVSVTRAGVPVANDVVTFFQSGTPPPACGTLSPVVAITNAVGQATTIYISSLTAGFCRVMANDASGGAGSVTLTQTSQAPNILSVVANPPVIPADGASTSAIRVTVMSLGGLPVAGDLVAFTETGTPPPACGLLNPPAAVTNGLGQATTIYFSSMTAGLCMVTASDSSGATGHVTVTQTAPPNTLVLMANPTTIPANGISSSTITITVTNAGVPVVNDPVSLTESGIPPSACGTVTPAALITNALGQATSNYVSSPTPGFCSITATDISGGSGSVTLTQTGSLLPNTLTLVANPTSIPADGLTTSTLTVTVMSAAGLPVLGDLVTFTLNGTPPSACGTLIPVTAVTSAVGQAVSTYTSSLTVGLCTITVHDSSGATSSVTLVQHA